MSGFRDVLAGAQVHAPVEVVTTVVVMREVRLGVTVVLLHTNVLVKENTNLPELIPRPLPPEWLGRTLGGTWLQSLRRVRCILSCGESAGMGGIMTYHTTFEALYPMPPTLHGMTGILEIGATRCYNPSRVSIAPQLYVSNARAAAATQLSLRAPAAANPTIAS